MRLAILVAILVAGCATPSSPPALTSPAAQGSVESYHGADRVATAPPATLGTIVAHRTDKDAVEPTLVAARDGSILFVGYEDVWRSRDEGASWEKVESLARTDVPVTPACVLRTCGPQPTTYDPWLALDPVTGRIHVDHLLDAQFLCTYHAWSDDAGASWDEPHLACPSAQMDYQKMAWGVPGPEPNPDANGKSVGYLCYNKPTGVGADGAPITGYVGVYQVACTASYDGGASWKNEQVLLTTALVQSQTAIPVECPGPFWAPTPLPDGVTIVRVEPDCLFATRDSGATWTLVGHVAKEILGGVTAAGRDRTLYLLGLDASGHGLLLERSRDDGRTWEGPWRVDPPNVRAWTLPALVAGDAGRIVVAFVGTREPLNDSANAPRDTPWNAYVVTSDDALSAQPTFTARQATPDSAPLTFGCISRSGCPFLGDFETATLAPDGTPYAVFAGACHAACRAASPPGPDNQLRYAVATVVSLQGWSAYEHG